MTHFIMNGRVWRVLYVHRDDERLIDRSGRLTVATTDPTTSCVYLSSALTGEYLQRVFLHELGHAAMISYDLLPAIHSMVRPNYWIEMEEWICNFIADYGFEIFSTADSVLGGSVWGVRSRIA